MSPTKKLFLLTIFCLPLYLNKILFKGLNFNVLDFLALISIFVFLTTHNKQTVFAFIKRNKSLFAASFLLFGGLLFSWFLNSPSISGLGIIISWFALPFLFSLFGSILLKNLNETVHFLLVFYFSATVVSVVALVYKMLGIMTYDNRLSAFFDSPNQLAMFLAPSIFIGSSLLFKKCFASYARLIYLTLPIILLASYFTFSYGNWFAIFFSFCVLFLMQRNLFTKKQLWLFLVIIFVFSLFFSSQFSNQKFQAVFQKNPHSSLASREMIWSSSTKIITDHFFAGIGPGNFQKQYLAYQKYFPPYLEWAVPEPHNVYLAFWLQTGLVGLIGFIFLLILVFRKIFQNKNASLAFLGFFVYFAVYGLIDTPYWKNDLAYLFWLFTFLSFGNFTQKNS